MSSVDPFSAASCDEDASAPDTPARRVRPRRHLGQASAVLAAAPAPSANHAVAASAASSIGRQGSRERNVVGTGRKALGILQPGARHGSGVLAPREPAAARCRFRQLSSSRRARTNTAGVAVPGAASGRVPAAARPRRAAVRTGSSSRSRGPATWFSDSGLGAGGAAVSKQRGPSEDACYAYSLANGMHWQRLQEWQGRLLRNSAVAAQGETNSGPQLLLVSLNKEVVLLKVGHKDCFVFAFGCLVCWGCNATEARAARSALQPFLLEPFAPQDVDEDRVEMHIFRQLREAQKVAVSKRDPPTFEKVALASALAQSVRLGSLELRIDRWVEKTKGIPETMARTGHVNVSSTKVTQMMGELFVLRNQVNLESAIVDTPDFFWDYDMLEPLYLHCRGHLDLDRRIAVLNQRFEVLQDLLDVLENELNDHHATRLEWVVIMLCALEAVFMALRFYERLMYDTPQQRSSNPEDATDTADASTAIPMDRERLPRLLRLPVLTVVQLATQNLVVRPAGLLAKFYRLLPTVTLLVVVAAVTTLFLLAAPCALRISRNLLRCVMRLKFPLLQGRRVYRITAAPVDSPVPGTVWIQAKSALALLS